MNRSASRVVIVGGGSAGLATAASLLRRRPQLSVTIVEPRRDHVYQPGLTLVGAGHFDPARLRRPQAAVVPRGADSVEAAVASFEPEHRRVVLEDGRNLAYDALVVAPGLELHVDGIAGAPGFVRESPLAGEDGWLPVDPHTLAHPAYPEIFGAGDVIGTGNARTMAAARRQAPVVATNLLACLDGHGPEVAYDGYGACPLTVVAGRVVLAEFAYGGVLSPTFPLEPAVPRRIQWWLERDLMPWIYWSLMLRGREWLARPGRRAAGAEAPGTAG